MNSSVYLFPLSEYWTFYLAFTAFVGVMLAVDLGLFHRHAHVVKFKEAMSWSIVWVSLALFFNFLLYRYCLYKFPLDPRLISLPGFDPAQAASQTALEFLTGYIIEYSLSVDNLFVFVMVFNYFAIPLKYQHRVLFYGILGAILFRVIFIALGSILMQYQGVVIFFGIFLMFTGVKMMFHPEQEIDPGKNGIIKLLKKFLRITSEFDGQRFFTKRGSYFYGTPLLVALVFLEVTDIVFAVDSVPAIYALTKEPFIVYTSNIFAILGLRSLYFMLAGVADKFHLLKYGLAIVLIFVGLKMVWLNEHFGGKFPISISLMIIGGVIAGSIALSFVFPPKKSEGE